MHPNVCNLVPGSTPAAPIRSSLCARVSRNGHRVRRNGLIAACPETRGQGENETGTNVHEVVCIDPGSVPAEALTSRAFSQMAPYLHGALGTSTERFGATLDANLLTVFHVGCA